MKTNLLVFIFLLFVSSGCAPRFSLFPEKPSAALSTPPPSAPATTAAKSLAAEDAQTEKVTLDALVAIARATRSIRNDAANAPQRDSICKTADAIDAAIASVYAEIRAHPSKQVGKTLVTQAKQIDKANTPSTRVLVIGYGGGAACIILALVVMLASGWLATVPLIGKFLVDNIGSHVISFLLVLGAGMIAATRAYVWTCDHPVVFKILSWLVVATIIGVYFNAYNEGYPGKIKAWFVSKLPWVKHTALELAKLQGDKAPPVV